MAANGMEMVGETECADITINQGEQVYVHSFSETYEAPPKVYYDCNGKEYELSITNTEVTITMSDTSGSSGHLCVFIQDNL